MVRRACSLDLHQARYIHKRGKIDMVSRRSLNKLALLVKSCGVTFESVMTLTFGQNYPMSGREAKRMLNSFLVQSKRGFGNYEYVWVLEFQERGAVHFHLALTLPPPTDSERETFSEIWQRISTPMHWQYCPLPGHGQNEQKSIELWTDFACLSVHNHPKAWEAVRKSDGVGRYFAKYANKLRQKKVPVWYSDVGRFWGASRGVKLPDAVEVYGTDSQVREFLEAKGRNVQNWQALPKIVLF